jgi:hypothetical protein
MERNWKHAEIKGSSLIHFLPPLPGTDFLAPTQNTSPNNVFLFQQRLLLLSTLFGYKQGACRTMLPTPPHTHW